MTKRYYAKILLFGEYTVMDGSAAIAVPFKRYYGQWSYEPTSVYKDGLPKLKAYLAKEYYNGRMDNVDFDTVERDIARGLSFESSIPTGYGLGSSGTLTAAFFDSYVKKQRYTLRELKQVLGHMESCFHGNSSGTDPLVSYLNTPLLIHPDGDVELLDIDRSAYLAPMRLLDTGIPRQTGPLVEAYKHTRSKVPAFAEATLELGDLSDSVVEAYIMDDRPAYVQHFRALSARQLEVVPMLIPDEYQELWQAGLDEEAFYMKLCGAGRGGFFLLHEVDAAATARILADKKVHSIL